MNKVKDNSEQLGTESIGRLIFRLSVPAVLAQIVNMLYNMVDRMYIGHIPKIGADALTGVGVGMPVILLISAFAALISMGAAPRASIAMGAGKKEEAEEILGNSTTMLLLLSLVLTGVFLVFGKDLLLLFGASENTIGYAWDYLSIYVMGTVFVQLALGLNAFVTAQGFAKTSMLTVLIGAVLNIILDPIFIFTFDMGVKGAAIATVIAQAVSALWVVRFLRGEKTNWRIQAKYMRPRLHVLLPCLALGLSPFIMQATESIISLVFNSSLYRYGGDLAVGSMAILSSVMQFSILPLSGVTQGTQPIISYNFGAKNGQRVKDAFKILLKTCLAYSFAFWLIIMLFPKVFPLMFTNDAALVEFTAWAIRIYMAANLIFGIQIACQQTFIALGNAKASIFLAILRKIILLIPFIYILPHFFQNQLLGVFMAEPIADTLAVLVTGTLFAREFKRAMDELEQETDNTEIAQDDSVLSEIAG